MIYNCELLVYIKFFLTEQNKYITLFTLKISDHLFYEIIKGGYICISQYKVTSDAYNLQLDKIIN